MTLTPDIGFVQVLASTDFQVERKGSKKNDASGQRLEPVHWTGYVEAETLDVDTTVDGWLKDVVAYLRELSVPEMLAEAASQVGEMEELQEMFSRPLPAAPR